MNRFLLFALGMFSYFSRSQSFAPAPGNIGSTAIYSDSSIIIDWASEVLVNRGSMNILNPSAGLASFGEDSDAIGIATGSQVVSLGDGGEAIVTFNEAIVNGIGPDFAVFENGFTDDYIELAFVEVSSDGSNFFRFDGISETPIDVQTTNFTFTDCRYIHNLAGKYRFGYGTPFDLDELAGIQGLDINHITHVKIIDVIGSIDSFTGTQDSQGNIINDPFPTEYETSGFDLDAVAVIHSETEGINELNDVEVNVFPNPSQGVFTIKTDQELSYSICDLQGRAILSGTISDVYQLDMMNFESGVYSIRFNSIFSTLSIQLILK
ncbi:MAG: T9SS type A sorting domain-containing protein [Crocinitomicaceae bacterium]